MNRKKIKVLRRKAKKILVEWLKSLLPEEEQDKVNVNNILQLMPKQTHYINEFQLYLSAWSFKWVMKKLKRNPEWTFEEINNSAGPSKRQLRRQKMIDDGPIPF
tara:strand:+ start:3787 stop:4098 length:312 start_codon:yes stop_codon:yes gene_type:complete